jgi:dGTPase
MKEDGGFEHNRHSLRIVEEIEQKYPGFPGLNLSWEVREGLLKHDSYELPETGKAAKSTSLEAQVANLSDEIAYYSHDLDDGLEAGLLDEKKLEAEVPIWAQAAEYVKKQFGPLPNECRRYYTIRCIIDEQVKDVVSTSEAAIGQAGIQSADQARASARPLIRYSPPRKRLNLELRKYLYRNFYYHPVVYEPNFRATRMMRGLFEYYLEHPGKLGGVSRRKIRELGLARAVCDYIAGMTDLFVIKEHERLIGKQQRAGEVRTAASVSKPLSRRNSKVGKI